MRGCRRQLQRVESCRHSIRERQILPSQGPYQDLQTPVLVEDDLRDALALEHGDEKSDEYGLARARRTADEGMPDIRGPGPFAIGRIAGMQRKVVRGASL